jgi:gamma-glutamylcyclotransferase (GGCT)/AIG2-like uncharacterized protein YtfP
MQPFEFVGNQVYFAYDANLCRAHMSLWCPDAEPLSRATLPHYRLIFRTWADVAPSPPDHVPGALYELGPKDMAALDEFEDHPRLYHRLNVLVSTESGPVDAVTYQMNPGRALALPGEDYLNLLLEGYEDWGLDPEQLSHIAAGRTVQ